MRLLLLIPLSLCALIFDYKLYRFFIPFVKHHPKKRWILSLFFGYAIAVDVLIFAVIFFGYHWPFYGPNSISSLPLWLAWFFFLNTVPKCNYFIFYLISKITGPRDRSISKWIRRTGMALAILTAFLLIKGAFYDARHFKINYVTITSDKIPLAFNGYRIALFTDVHLGNLAWQEKHLTEAVERINALRPDIIVHAGDLVNMYASEITPQVQEILSGLRGNDGVYSVLGNHDMGPYFGNRIDKIGLTPLENTALVIQKTKEMGWRILQNESLHIHRGSDSIGLCGLPYPPWPRHFADSLTSFNPELTTHLLNPSGFNIMLCHTPAVWENMQDDPSFRKADLILSGHTHAMQMKIKIGSWQWSPAKYMYKYWSGLYEHRGRYLYVNEGIGYVIYPMRIGSRPEITLFTLQTKGE